MTGSRRVKAAGSAPTSSVVRVPRAEFQRVTKVRAARDLPGLRAMVKESRDRKSA